MEKTRQPAAIIPAIILIGVGVLFLLLNTGVLGTLNMGQLWPIFPTLAGLALLVPYFSGWEHGPDIAIGGMNSLMIGLFFFLFTLNVTIEPLERIQWSDMARLWPSFIIIPAVAFGLRWLMGGRRKEDLWMPWMVLVLLVLGIAGFLFTFGGFTAFGAIINYWPVLLIASGVIVLLWSFRRSSPSPQ